MLFFGWQYNSIPGGPVYVFWVTWMRHDKLPPESSLSFEVDNKTAFIIDSHAGRIHGTCNKMITQIRICQRVYRFLDLFVAKHWDLMKALLNLSKLFNYSSVSYQLTLVFQYLQYGICILPCSSASGGLPIPSCHKMAVSYTKVSLSSDRRSKCCQPPTATGEWKT